jgi:hypothetical protein
MSTKMYSVIAIFVNISTEGHKWTYTQVFHIYWPIWEKFQTSDLDTILLSVWHMN